MTERPQSMVEIPSDLDIHQLLVPTPAAETPRPRDSASNASIPSSDAGSFFVPEPLSRSNSVYSFSRASLSSQLGSLTSLSLPQAESLAASITALPTAIKAIRALNNAAEQIMSWTKRALRVLKNLDADDDVEWAAAAGREALDEADKTITRFETLVSVYVLSIEELQLRPDIGEVKHTELSQVVEQMETTLDSWESVRQSMKKLHDQVELAMEWEELWNTVLHDVGAELDSLSALVFEMEEKRHQAYLTQTSPEPPQNINLKELENFIEEPSAKKRETMNARFSMSFIPSSLEPPAIDSNQDDTDLLALFARMQPLRASLDFLPMRLSLFQQRAEASFPTACKELEDKKERFDKNWVQLQDEAETLRRELSEDRWIVVFRNAARQAEKMLDSVEKSVTKAQEAIDEGYPKSNPAALAKRIESFEAKKLHYMPAVQRVLGIIQKGLKDRLTINGEILRLHRDLSSRSRALEDKMSSIMTQLEPVTPRHGMGLRESISSLASGDRSISSVMASTPGTSPASSVDMTTTNNLSRPQYKYGLNGYTKQGLTSARGGPPPASANRRASLQLRPNTPSQARRIGASPAPPSVYRQGVYRPPTVTAPQRPQSTTPGSKPRWSAVISQTEADKAAKFSRSSSTTPGARNRFSTISTTAIPFRSPLSRETSTSPAPDPLGPRASNSHLRSFAERVGSPSPARSNLLDTVPYSKSRNSSGGMPHSGPIRAPSGLATHSERPSSVLIANGGAIPRPPSSLNRSFGVSRGQGLPIRVSEEAMTGGQRTPRSSFDSGRSLELDDLEDSSNANNEDEDYDDGRPAVYGSLPHDTSPLSNRKAAAGRPLSSLSSSTRGSKRGSMLPVPVSSGRMSSLGQN